MGQLPNCPECNSEYTYEDGHLIVCPECAHEWVKGADGVEEEEFVFRDAHGNELNDSDDITVIKDLKLRGGSGVIKIGTKAKNITLIKDPSDGHDIECRVDGFGQMKLRSEFVKKA